MAGKRVLYDDKPKDGLDRTPSGMILAGCALCGGRQAAAIVIGRLRKPVCMKHYEEYWSLAALEARREEHGAHETTP